MKIDFFDKGSEKDNFKNIITNISFVGLSYSDLVEMFGEPALVHKEHNWAKWFFRLFDINFQVVARANPTLYDKHPSQSAIGLQKAKDIYVVGERNFTNAILINLLKAYSGVNLAGSVKKELLQWMLTA